MGIKAEQAQWFKGKDKIIDDFSRERRNLLQAVARQVDQPPGYLGEAITDLEIKAKYALSDLNYQIISEALEREMTQQNIEYDQRYRKKLIEWEIEKAGLLDDLTRELTDSRKAKEDRETVLANLAVEIGLRKVALSNAKTLLNNEMEQVQKEIAEAQGQTLPKEHELAQARLDTARRKLDVIPHLEALLEAQEDLLAAEELNIPHMENLVDERMQMIPIKEDIVGLKETLISSIDALTDPKLEVAEKKKLLAQIRTDYEDKAATRLTPELDFVAAAESLNAAMQVYINKRGELVDPYLERATKLQELIEPRNAYAKALTENIPYIQELAEKRRELIVPNLEKAERLGALINPLLEKAEKTIEVAEAAKEESEIELDTRNIYHEIEALKKEGVEADLSVMRKSLEEEQYRKALVEAGVALKTLQTENQVAITQKESVDSAAYLSAKEIGQIKVVEKEKEATTVEIDTRYDVAKTRVDSRLESVKTTIGVKVGPQGSIEKIARDRADAKRTISEINANANITSRLIHNLT